MISYLHYLPFAAMCCSWLVFAFTGIRAIVNEGNAYYKPLVFLMAIAWIIIFGLLCVIVGLITFK